MAHNLQVLYPCTYNLIPSKNKDHDVEYKEKEIKIKGNKKQHKLTSSTISKEN